MKKHIALVTATIAALALTGSAIAADLSRPVLKAPPAPLAVFSWTGFYIGLNGGYSWGRSRTTGTLSNATTGAVIATASNRFNLNGGLFGGQIGYNWQAGNLVYGLETDIQWADEKGRTLFTCNLAACLPTAIPPGGAVAATVALNQKIDWFGTFRGRLGMTVTPTVLVYATGGLAYGNVKTGALVSGFGANGLGAPVFVAGNFDSTHAGWTVGAGIEGQLFGNWTGKLEYLYMDLGRHTGSATLLTSFPPLVGAFSSRVTDNVFRAGINYKL
jgi:outer membrane immunogenic protein